ncbi:MAG: hypothetical protein Q4G71_08220 [Pseudomonadota bacterium]|nr:hypothetical protein [Pseudomonadota bacterium]
MSIAFFSRWWPAPQVASPAPRGDVAAQLMARADACRGLSPHDAAELRRAAMAYLGVVR